MSAVSKSGLGACFREITWTRHFGERSTQMPVWRLGFRGRCSEPVVSSLAPRAITVATGGRGKQAAPRE